MTRKTFTKPKKENLLVRRGEREVPDSVGDIMKGINSGEQEGTKHYFQKKNTPIVMEPEDLDAEGLAKKRATIDLLTKEIMPNSLSAKSSDLADKRSMVNKLNRRSLKELGELLPSRIKRMKADKIQALVDGSAELREEESVEIQTLYADVSP